MDEILQKLLQSELLSEETKSEIATQWNESVDSYKKQLKEEAIIEVRAELAEQWTQERDELIEKIDGFVAEHLQNEIVELKDDIDRFRDLEAEYAEKLVEEKHELANQLATELDQLVDKMDSFFELRLSEEIEELKEDLDVVKQNDFGRRMFEAFSEEYSKNYVNEDSTESKLNAAKQQLKDVEKRLSEKEETLNSMIREGKMKDVLSSLSGKKKEQMEFILKNVETPKLQEAYNYFINRVLKEETKVTEVIAESKKEEETVVVTGDDKGVITEEKKEDVKNSDAFSRLRKLASIQ